MNALDLSTPEGRAAYRAELRQVAFWPRMAGFGLIIGAALVLVWNLRFSGAPSSDLTVASYVAMGLGWALVLIAIVLRTRYHRRRLSDG
ncbi:MAG: hypothetical protein JSR45_07475 [Proteobacteria bacterium]|nr:hypothetical protein [Pseudomonadota bacterium]